MPAFTVSRTTHIKSDPETVFSILSDFATWKTWSPWLLTDKDAKVTLQGDPTAVGGGYSWDGPVVGAGEMEHQELHRPTADDGYLHMGRKLLEQWAKFFIWHCCIRVVYEPAKRSVIIEEQRQ